LVGLACVQNLLNHLAELIDLDRKDALISPLKIEFLDRSPECQVDRFDTMPQDILKTYQQRKLEITSFGLLDDIRDIHVRACFLQGLGDDMTGLVYVEVLRTPTLDVIEIASCLDIPGGEPGVRTIHDFSSNQRTIGRLLENSIEVMKKIIFFLGILATEKRNCERCEASGLLMYIDFDPR
jgi:hypothetical protein